MNNTTTEGGVKERSVIFSADNVKAILAGRKFQTRRVMKPQPIWDGPDIEDDRWYWPSVESPRAVWRQGEWNALPVFCPYGKPGDRLWVREVYEVSPSPGCSFGDFMMGRKHTVTYRAGGSRDLNGYSEVGGGMCIDVSSDAGDYPMEKYGIWRSPIHMPRWASRITLEIKGVRVQRLAEATEADALAEGVESLAAYRTLWDGIHGVGAWDRNDWVWAISFKVTK